MQEGVEKVTVALRRNLQEQPRFGGAVFCVGVSVFHRGNIGFPICCHMAFLYQNVIILLEVTVMHNILEEFWYGNICPNMMCHKDDEETKNLMEYVARHHEQLLGTLAEEQREILEKFDDCYTELIDIYEREIFVYAFRLGAQMMLEVMSKE